MSDHVDILPAVFTPMEDDGSINYKQVQTLYKHCADLHFRGVFLNGTTGECMSLSVKERMKLLETWIECRRKSNNAGFKIFAHVGSCNMMEAADMASHAKDTGADAIAMVPSFYFRPKTLTDLIDQCRYVAAAAPSLPFYYYNIPSLTGVNFPLTAFLERAIKEIPSFAGLKNSFNDLVDYQQCLHASKGKYAMYWGTDEVFMMVYAGGNRHYVGSTYTFMRDIYLQMLTAHDEGNVETLLDLQEAATGIYRILNEYNSLVAGKEVMRIIGVDCGPVRGPLRNLKESERSQLIERLEKSRFFEFAASAKPAGMSRERVRKLSVKRI
jgi:N-acetylneuraminate lyase